MTTLRCFSSAVKLPTGVGRVGLPIEAGIVRSISPSLLTVKVWPEMLAIPRNASPVSKPVVSSCTPTETWLWAGQYWFGTHCTTLFSGHSKCPDMLVGEATGMDRGGRARSGPHNAQARDRDHDK